MNEQTASALRVRIEKPIYGGNFLARLDSKALFVPRTLVGEEALVRIAEDKRGFARAELVEILSASTERIEPRCPHFALCGGCDYQHTHDAQQLAIKEAILRETLERAGLQAPDAITIHSAEPWQYRNRIRLAFDTAGRIGYRERSSHALIPLADCPIAAPLLLEATHAAEGLLRTTAHQLRPAEIALFTNHDQSALQASLVVRNADKPAFDRFAAALAERVPELSGAALLLQPPPPRNRRQRAPEPRTIARRGALSIDYRVAGLHYRVDLGAFFQVNRWLVDELVACVAANAQGSLAWDLFAGVGLFARALAERFERVIAVESAPASTAALAANLGDSSGKAIKAQTAEFLHSSGAKEQPEFIVVDPPRAGLGPEVSAALARSTSQQIVYVSCDPATLARDLKTLLAGGYAIASVDLFDLFPQTFHLETVVHLRRA